jgi:hypothetical protein
MKARSSFLMNIGRAVDQFQHDKMVNQVHCQINDDRFSQDDQKSNEATNQHGIDLYDSYMNFSHLRLRSGEVNEDDEMQFKQDSEHQSNTM